ncbi:DNA-binding protein [Mycena sanguinolenta]|uniref:DNA-binding protein n=1 Tax=Mycena sanguinolenta TaxID=230812 RepID=A0A8H6Z6M1_9AGAR|nr:DNA-binding protein [Mycena sanguinolenta]
MLGAVFDGLTLVVAVFRWIVDSYQDTPEPLPPSLRALVRNRKLVLKEYPTDRVREWRISRRPPSFLARIFPLRPYDTASASFYRIYEFAVLDDNIRFRNEIEYFCHRQWPVSPLPDPRDFDPERLAFLAALARIFVHLVQFSDRDGAPSRCTCVCHEFRGVARAAESMGKRHHSGHRTRVRWTGRFVSMHPKAIPELSSHLGEMGIIMKAPHYLFT